MTHILTLNTQENMTRYQTQVWKILSDSYQTVSGGLHYTSPKALIEESDQWQILVKDGIVLAVTVYKAKQGWKLVAMGIHHQYIPQAKSALAILIKSALNHSWMELSEGAERFVMKHCDGHKYMIHISIANKLLGKFIEPSTTSQYHYKRKIMDKVKTKILLGSPMMTFT
nr:hypothetical protein [Vibrio alfacsensis]